MVPSNFKASVRTSLLRPPTYQSTFSPFVSSAIDKTQFLNSVRKANSELVCFNCLCLREAYFVWSLGTSTCMKMVLTSYWTANLLCLLNDIMPPWSQHIGKNWGGIRDLAVVTESICLVSKSRYRAIFLNWMISIAFPRRIPVRYCLFKLAEI